MPNTPAIYMPDPGLMLSDAELAKVEQIGSVYNFLRYYAKGDRTFDFDDFSELGAIGDYQYALANSGGAGATDFVIPATRVKNGVISANTGTTDNGSLSLIGPLIYRGADNAGMEVRLKVDQVAAGYNLEVGFIDAVPGSNAGGVTDEDTPTAAFTSGGVVAIDTDETLKTLGFYSKGNAASQAIQATTLTSPTVLVLDTYMRFSVMLVRSGASTSICHALAFIDGVLVAKHAPAVGAVNAATLLAPWIYVRTRSTTAVLPTVDYIARWDDRNA